MYRQAVKSMLKPSYWRFVFAIRSAITACFVALPWFLPNVFHLGDRFQLQAIILGVWTFNLQNTYTGGNWKQAGRFVVIGCVAIALGIVSHYIPGVTTTWYGAGVFLACAVGLIEILTMAQILGLKRPYHIFCLVVVIDSIYIAESITSLLYFWIVLSVAIPFNMVMTSILLWPHPAHNRLHEDAAHILHELMVQFALVQRLAFGDDSVRPSAEWMAKHRHKVLGKLAEMESLISNDCDAELWIGDTAPLRKLRNCLAYGWFVVTSMRALVMDNFQQSPSIAKEFHSADAAVFLELSSAADRLNQSKKSPTASEILHIDATGKLQRAVDMSYQQAREAGWGAGRAHSRYNAFLLSCLAFRSYLPRLRETVEESTIRRMRGNEAVVVVGNIFTRLFHHIRRALWDSWAKAWPRLCAQWNAKRWHSMIRNMLMVGTAGALSFHWYKNEPESRAYWIVVTVVVLTMDNLGQSLLKGILRLLAVFLAWVWSLLILNISYNDYRVWLPLLFIYTIPMAYLQQDPTFGYLGAAGFITFYVCAFQCYNDPLWSVEMMTYRALMVALGVVWAVVFFLIVFPLDGMRDPMDQLRQATELLYQGFDRIADAHVQGNMSQEVSKEVEGMLFKATMLHHQFVTCRFHTGIMYHLFGAFYAKNRHTYAHMNALSLRIVDAIASMRLLLLIGAAEFDRQRTANIMAPLFNHFDCVREQMQTLKGEVCESLKGQSNDPQIPHTDAALGTMQAADLLLAEFYAKVRAMQIDQSLHDMGEDLPKMDGFVYLYARAAHLLARMGTPKAPPSTTMGMTKNSSNMSFGATDAMAKNASSNSLTVTSNNWTVNSTAGLIGQPSSNHLGIPGSAVPRIATFGSALDTINDPPPTEQMAALTMEMDARANLFLEGEDRGEKIEIVTFQF